jgi:hypothetical protein
VNHRPISKKYVKGEITPGCHTTSLVTTRSFDVVLLVVISRVAFDLFDLSVFVMFRAQVNLDSKDLVPDEMHGDMRIVERQFMVIVVWAWTNSLLDALIKLIHRQTGWKPYHNPKAKLAGEKCLLPKSFDKTIKKFPCLDLTGLFRIINSARTTTAPLQIARGEKKNVYVCSVTYLCVAAFNFRFLPPLDFLLLLNLLFCYFFSRAELFPDIRTNQDDNDNQELDLGVNLDADEDTTVHVDEDRQKLYAHAKRLSRLWTEFWEMVFLRNGGFANAEAAATYQLKYEKWLILMKRTITQGKMVPYMHIGEHGAEHGLALHQLFGGGQETTMNQVSFCL